MRSLQSKTITHPVAFKAVPYSRRGQLWNRQALIVAELTILAFRHGWCRPSDASAYACDAFRRPVGGASINPDCVAV